MPGMLNIGDKVRFDWAADMKPATVLSIPDHTDDLPFLVTIDTLNGGQMSMWSDMLVVVSNA
jgi:hypothetical protein